MSQSKVIADAECILGSMGIECLELRPDHTFAEGIRFNHDGCVVEIKDGVDPVIAVKGVDDDNMSWEWVPIDQYRAVIADPMAFI